MDGILAIVTWVLSKWRSVSFGEAVLLVFGLPVYPLAASATIQQESTPRTSRKPSSPFTTVCSVIEQFVHVFEC